MNLYVSKMIRYTLESKIEQVQNRINIDMNDHFEKLRLQGMNREETIIKELRKVIGRLNHRLAYLEAIKRIKENNENTY